MGKVLGGAVERNRIRRRMRAAVRLKLFQLAAPLDIALHPRKSVLTLDFERLGQEVEQVFAAVQKGKTR